MCSLGICTCSFHHQSKYNFLHSYIDQQDNFRSLSKEDRKMEKEKYCSCDCYEAISPISCHFIWFHTFPSPTVLFYFISFHVILYHVMSFHFVCHVISCHFVSCHVMSCHVISCHFMSFHVIYSQSNQLVCAIKSLTWEFDRDSMMQPRGCVDCRYHVEK